MKNIMKSIGFALAMVSLSAQAIPTLFFDGQLNYTASTGILNVNSVLTGSNDLGSPLLTTGSLDFTASYISTLNIGTTLISQFGTSPSIVDLTATTPSTTLLNGTFNNLLMVGNTGNDFAALSATFTSTGGLFANQFTTSQIITLVFNLPTINSQMFQSNFNGHIDGRIEGQFVNIPEPSILALLSFGLVLGGLLPGLKRK